MAAERTYSRELSTAISDAESEETRTAVSGLEASDAEFISLRELSGLRPDERSAADVRRRVVHSQGLWPEGYLLGLHVLTGAVRLAAEEPGPVTRRR